MAACSASAGAKSARDNHWSGTVTWVSDGDTLWIAPQDGARSRKIRLDGIDAPEICQPWGAAARDALRSRVLRRRVEVKTRRLDDYRRELAKVSIAGHDVGGWMVAQGHAWSYRYRHNSGPYVAEQNEAQRAHRGLFADPDARNPRDFRKTHGPCD